MLSQLYQSIKARDKKHKVKNAVKVNKATFGPSPGHRKSFTQHNISRGHNLAVSPPKENNLFENAKNEMKSERPDSRVQSPQPGSEAKKVAENASGFFITSPER